MPASRTDAIAIYSLATAGITNGVADTTFEPDRAVTREQMASLMIRANENTFCQTLPSVTSFPDTVGIGHEANIR